MAERLSSHQALAEQNCHERSWGLVVYHIVPVKAPPLGSSKGATYSWSRAQAVRKNKIALASLTIVLFLIQNYCLKTV